MADIVFLVSSGSESDTFRIPSADAELLLPSVPDAERVEQIIDWLEDRTRVKAKQVVGPAAVEDFMSRIVRGT